MAARRQGFLEGMRAKGPKRDSRETKEPGGNEMGTGRGRHGWNECVDNRGKNNLHGWCPK
jgi:hypothetical protein